MYQTDVQSSVKSSEIVTLGVAKVGVQKQGSELVRVQS